MVLKRFSLSDRKINLLGRYKSTTIMIVDLKVTSFKQRDSLWIMKKPWLVHIATSERYLQTKRYQLIWKEIKTMVLREETRKKNPVKKRKREIVFRRSWITLSVRVLEHSQRASIMMEIQIPRQLLDLSSPYLQYALWWPTPFTV